MRACAARYISCRSVRLSVRLRLSISPHSQDRRKGFSTKTGDKQGYKPRGRRGRCALTPHAVCRRHTSTTTEGRAPRPAALAVRGRMRGSVERQRASSLCRPSSQVILRVRFVSVAVIDNAAVATSASASAAPASFSRLPVDLLGPAAQRIGGLRTRRAADERSNSGGGCGGGGAHVNPL